MEKNPHRQPFGDHTNREIAELEREWKENEQAGKEKRAAAKVTLPGTVFHSGGGPDAVKNPFQYKFADDEVRREREVLSPNHEGEHNVG